MTEQAKPISRPWRKFLRFSVRGLIVLVLVVGGWLGWIVRSARIQRAAVAALNRDQVSVSYDWEWENDLFIEDSRPPWPSWMVEALGVDYFGHVVGASFGWTNVFPTAKEGTDVAIGRLGGLNGLEMLTLSSMDVTGAGLAHLKELTDLEVLYLDSGLLPKNWSSQ